jgi:hypothetical protein
MADVDLSILDALQAARGRDVIPQAACLPHTHVPFGTMHRHLVPATLELGGAWIRRNREFANPSVESVSDTAGTPPPTEQREYEIDVSPVMQGGDGRASRGDIYRHRYHHDSGHGGNN